MPRLSTVWLVAALALFVALVLFPFLVVVGLSVTDYSPALAYRAGGFVGLDNYRTALHDEVFLSAVAFSARLSVVSTVLQISAAAVLGLALARRPAVARWVLPPLLIASFLPAVTTALMFKFLLQSSYGALPYILDRIVPGFEGGNILGRPARAFWVFVACDAWQWLPILTLLLYVGAGKVRDELRDACTMDGGGTIDQVRTVVGPALAPYLVVAGVLRGLETFKLLEPALLLTGGGPGTQTEVVHLFLWRVGFRLWDSGYAAALAVMTYIVVLAVLFTSFSHVRRVLRWT